MTDPLQRFVQQSVSRGMPKQDLQETLVKAGWPRDLVLQYLGKTIAVTSTPGKPILRVQGVTKTFHGRKVLDNVNLDITQGEVFGIIGQSGSGKTTLLNLLVGFLQPDAGSVSVWLPKGPQSVTSDPEATKSFIGFAAQSPSVQPDLTIAENINYFSQLHGKSERQAQQAAQTLSKLVGLHDYKDVRASELSGGMQKRLDLACALVHDPKLLILDEPVADLDVVLRAQLWDVLRAINKQGTTILIASHFLAELEQVCDRIGIMRNNRVAEIGTPEELRVIYSRNQEIRLELASHAYENVLAVLKKDATLQVSKTIKDGNRLKIQTAQPTATLDAILKDARQRKDSIVHVEMGRPTVRELFEELLT